jgi:hypothetical protein
MTPPGPFPLADRLLQLAVLLLELTKLLIDRFEAALLTYREVCYDIPPTEIEIRNGTLHFHQRPQGIATPCIRGPFPDHLTTNTKHREAALTVNQCTTAMALLGRLTRKRNADLRPL